MRYFAEIRFDGGTFHGWQRQPFSLSVQEVIEFELGRLFSSNNWPIIGCGRTDAGVHATQFFFHFDLATDLHYTTDQLCYKLNRLLPDEISCQRIFQVSDELHARYSAISRTYEYRIHTEKDPFKKAFSTYIRDFDSYNSSAMNRLAAYLLNTQEFRSLCKSHSDVSHYRCNISLAEWQIIDDQHVFTIRSNRFLRGMVRLIVGCMINVGRGKTTLEEITSAIEAQLPIKSILSAPPQGLSLTQVEYNMF